ncbi:MAG: response regulator [Bacteroidia bacterium]|nr:response regulator [Bacteroidia bacterium]MDW8301127.1 response regulator [Bacteroidia bacterium]
MKKMAKILIVEDNPAELLILEKAIQKAIPEVQIDKVADGIKCLDYLYETDSLPNCMILDLNLPDQDGRAVLKMLQVSEELSKLNVIVLTGSEDPEDKIYCNRLGVKGYYLKSLVYHDFTELIEHIKKLLA